VTFELFCLSFYFTNFVWQKTTPNKFEFEFSSLICRFFSDLLISAEIPAEKSDGAKEPEDVLPRQSRWSLNDHNHQYVKIENEQLVKGAAVAIRKQRKNLVIGNIDKTSQRENVDSDQSATIKFLETPDSEVTVEVRGAKPVSSKSAEKISGMMDVYFVI
jgi:hypothetical protein